MAPKLVKPRIDHILIVEDDRGRKEIFLKNQTYVLGRANECDIRLHSQFISRYHATLLKKSRSDGSEYYQIVDGILEGKPSVNGLVVNGRKVARHNLANRDEIVFGQQVTATYQNRQRDIFPTTPPNDPFDITLIDPAMVEIPTPDESD